MIDHLGIIQFIMHVIMLEICTLYLLKNKKEANEPLEFKA